MGKIPTVAIVYENHPDGYMLINESDFDEKIHKKYDPNVKKVQKKKKIVKKAKK